MSNNGAYRTPQGDLDYDEDDYCDECGAELDYVDCWACGGTGYAYEDEECTECDGDGGYYECTELPHDDMTPADHATLRADFEQAIYREIDKEPPF